MTQDRIRLSGVRARGFHGVLADERRDGQEFVVDVELAVDLSAAGASDELSSTVDYSALAVAVVDEITGPPCDLIEALAERIADRVLDDPRIAEVTVTVHKPQAPIAVAFDDVAVTVVRHRA